MGTDLRSATAILTGPDQVVEVRGITNRGIYSGYFNDHDELVNRVEALDADPEVQGIYITLNTVNPALLARRTNRIAKLGPKDATTSDADILRRRWFPVDIDPVRPSGVSSSNGEHFRALAVADEIAAWMSQLGFPEPVKGDSGNGAHLLYRIDLPNDEDATNLVKRGLAVLDAIFSDKRVTVDTANFNAGRIWKLYGTVSRKGDSTQDRPHRRSQILSVPEKIEIVSQELLVKLGEALPAEERAEENSRAANGKRIDLGQWLVDHGIAVRSSKPYGDGTLSVLDQCPFSSAHKDGAYAIQYGNGAIFAGCHHDSCGGGTQRWHELREKFEKNFSDEKNSGKKFSEKKNSQKNSSREKNPEKNFHETREQRARRRAEQNGNVPAEENFSAAEEFSEEDRAKAIEILMHGDPNAFILDAYSHVHVGDELVAECYLVSFLSSSVLNSRGLHVCPTGDSGKGKSDSARGFLRMVPSRYRVQGSITSKALFYHEIPEGAVIIFDDFGVSEDLREVLKNATSDFHAPLRHRSLTTNRDPIVLNLPPRCVWWILSVDNPGDDQVLNRMLIPWIDDSEMQDRKVKERIFLLAAQSADEVHDTDAVRVVIAMLDEVRKQRLRVRVPFSERIMLDNFRNRRNSVMFLDMIRSFAALNFLQRTQRTLADGSIEIDADERDFHAAARLFTGLDTNGGGQTSKLLNSERLLIDTVIAMKTSEFTVGQLQRWMGLSFHHIWRILHGRSDKDRNNLGGLLAKCPALGVIDTMTSEDDGEVVRKRRTNHYTFDYEQYRRWDTGGRIRLSPESPDKDNPHFPIGPVQNENGETSGEVTIPDRSDLLPIPGSSNQNTGILVSEFPHNSGNTQSTDLSDQGMPESLCTYVPENRGNENPKTEIQDGNTEPASPERNPVSPIISPSGNLVGKRENELVKKNSLDPAGTVPLPGLFEYRDFERLRVTNGKCDVCKVNPGVFRDEKTRTYLCEVCYGRLVRDTNGKEQGSAGVR